MHELLNEWKEENIFAIFILNISHIYMSKCRLDDFFFFFL